jgi:hypothetical protein
MPLAPGIGNWSKEGKSLFISVIKVLNAIYLGDLYQNHCQKHGWQGEARHDPALPVSISSQTNI